MLSWTVSKNAKRKSKRILLSSSLVYTPSNFWSRKMSGLFKICFKKSEIFKYFSTWILFTPFLKRASVSSITIFPRIPAAIGGAARGFFSYFLSWSSLLSSDITNGVVLAFYNSVSFSNVATKSSNSSSPMGSFFSIKSIFEFYYEIFFFLSIPRAVRSAFLLSSIFNSSSMSTCLFSFWVMRALLVTSFSMIVNHSFLINSLYSCSVIVN